MQLEAHLVNLDKQTDVQVTAELTDKQLRKILNWKPNGPDGLEAHKPLKESIAKQRNECLQDDSVPHWILLDGLGY